MLYKFIPYICKRNTIFIDALSVSLTVERLATDGKRYGFESLTRQQNVV